MSEDFKQMVVMGFWYDKDPLFSQGYEAHELLEPLTAKDANNLVARIIRLNTENAYLQAKIDALMHEYCPEEMTAEQLANWAKHQKPVEE